MKNLITPKLPQALGRIGPDPIIGIFEKRYYQTHNFRMTDLAQCFHGICPDPGVIIVQVFGYNGNDGHIAEFPQGVESSGDDPFITGQAQHIEDGIESSDIAHLAGQIDIADELIDIALPEKHFGIFFVLP